MSEPNSNTQNNQTTPQQAESSLNDEQQAPSSSSGVNRAEIFSFENGIFRASAEFTKYLKKLEDYGVVFVQPIGDSLEIDMQQLPPIRGTPEELAIHQHMKSFWRSKLSAASSSSDGNNNNPMHVPQEQNNNGLESDKANPEDEKGSNQPKRSDEDEQ